MRPRLETTTKGLSRIIRLTKSIFQRTPQNVSRIKQNYPKISTFVFRKGFRIPTFVARMNPKFQSDSVALMFANYFHIAHPLESVVASLHSSLWMWSWRRCRRERLDAFPDLRWPRGGHRVRHCGSVPYSDFFSPVSAVRPFKIPPTVFFSTAEKTASDLTFREGLRRLGVEFRC